MVDTDFDVGLALAQTRRGQVQKCEVVLLREVLDLVGDPCEPSVTWVFGPREVVEETGQIAEEALGVDRERIADRPIGAARSAGF